MVKACDQYLLQAMGVDSQPDSQDRACARIRGKRQTPIRTQMPAAGKIPLHLRNITVPPLLSKKKHLRPLLQTQRSFTAPRREVGIGTNWGKKARSEKNASLREGTQWSSAHHISTCLLTQQRFSTKKPKSPL